ncbi:MAG TPA: hypothetical protein PLC42_04840 [Parachlamydiaceae bacterium]|nr:hypothetical protein [Parachlamydiaceae bacterium]
MKALKCLMFAIAAFSFATVMPLVAHEHGQEGGHEGGHEQYTHESHQHGDFSGRGQDRSRYLEELNQRDWDALRDYLKVKREEKEDDANGDDDDDCGLTISGDVRTEWRHMNEKGIDQDCNYRSLRGDGAIKDDVPVSKNDFDIECNIRFDYICDKTWGVAHIKFDNSAGVNSNGKSCKCDPEGFHGSGGCSSICLMKAYAGYNVYDCHDARFDVEIGRRNLYNTFDSRIQFLSRFDGILFKYSDSIKNVGDWYWNTAGFLIDERVNHFGWVTEIGILDICDSGFDLKYSFIDWQKHGENRCRIRNPRAFDFLVSQWTAAYHIDKKVLGAPAKLYGALMKNHSGVRVYLPYDECDNCAKEEDKYSVKGNPWGWYVGFIYGEVVDEGDWAFSVQYEWVGVTACPDDDASGIGTGNVLNNTITSNGRGNTNYKGVNIEFLYAFSENLSLNAILEWSRQIKKSIGGKHHYSKIELETIYAF